GSFFSGERHEKQSKKLCNFPLLCLQYRRKIFRFQVGRAIDKAKSKTYNSSVNFEAIATDPEKGWILDGFLLFSIGTCIDLVEHQSAWDFDQALCHAPSGGRTAGWTPAGAGSAERIAGDAAAG
ncbi:MAG: hypothetical protein Q3X94_03170, partial [Oscillospiraceae bacterium]|nr:hypothetical protein [Oscillospiraceae bacterium]